MEMDFDVGDCEEHQSVRDEVEERHDGTDNAEEYDDPEDVLTKLTAKLDNVCHV